MTLGSTDGGHGELRAANSDRDEEPLDAVEADRRPTEPDRQAAADTLRRALDEGRLGPAEFEEQVAAAGAAASQAELEALTAGLAAAERPARRSRLDALFDRVVVDSALVAASRHRVLRPVWLTSTVVTLLAYGYAVARHPVWGLSLLWLPAGGLLWLETAVVRRLAGPTRARRQSMLARLAVRLDLLRAAQPAITEIAVEYPAVEIRRRRAVRRAGVARIRIDFGAGPDAPDLARSVREEIIRLLWQSPLHPLREIRVGGSSVRLDGDEAARLRRRYGPRPHGPYREDQR
jgi:hypothetical protein